MRLLVRARPNVVIGNVSVVIKGHKTIYTKGKIGYPVRLNPHHVKGKELVVGCACVFPEGMKTNAGLALTIHLGKKTLVVKTKTVKPPAKGQTYSSVQFFIKL